MRTISTLLLAAFLFLLTACHDEREAVPPPAPYGVETAFPFSGSVAQQPFTFYLRRTNAWRMVGHAGYFNGWETEYEFNSRTDADGTFYFQLEYPMAISPYEAFRPGPLTKGFDAYYWQLQLAVPDGGGLARYRAADRLHREDAVVTRSQQVPPPARVRERSPILLDHQGQPYFEVHLRFEVPVVRTDTPEEKAYLFSGEGLFRVPVAWDQLEKQGLMVR
mgnify:CR=1 FL=1